MEKETKKDMEMEIKILEKFTYSRWAWNQAKFGVEKGKKIRSRWILVVQ